MSVCKNKIMENFPENRYRHVHSVGKKMSEYAEKVLHKDKNFCNKMFVLGVLHDIGYELVSPNDEEKHSYILADILKGYEYTKEISAHNTVNRNIQSLEYDLLLYADMVIDGNGKEVSYQERLNDLKNRHGINSYSYKSALEILSYLKEKGYKDKI